MAEAKGLRWYKGNLHMHSYWSDGRDFPEMIVRWFKAHGYHFIAFTEHNQLQTGPRWIKMDATSHAARSLPNGSLLAQYIQCYGEKWVDQREGESGPEVRLKPLHEYRHLFEEPESFLILTGEEIDAVHNNGQHWINAINLAEAIAPQPYAQTSVAAMRATLQAVDAAAVSSGRPLLAFLNHPNYEWNATAEDIAAVKGLRFVEIYTALNSTRTYGQGVHVGAERIWDIVLSLRLSQPDGEIIYGIASDDCHGYPGENPQPQGNHPGRAWVMVRAARLTPESIMTAMLRGDYYNSSGVTLRSLESGNRTLKLTIEAQEGAHYTTRFIGTRRGANLTSVPEVDEQGREIQTTRRYPEDVGEVLAEVQGLEASYEFDGDEFYVRALVTSDQPHPNPTVPGDVMKAWTQPFTPQQRKP
jgi:hypothetical protein